MEYEVAHFSCSFCSKDLNLYTLSERQLHYEDHLTGNNDSVKQPISAANDITASAKRNKWKPNNLFRGKEQDVFWYPSLGSQPPKSYTPGLIPLLKKGLLSSHARGNLRRAALCHDGAVHISREIWDASWGCGYRNFLMACAALVEQQSQPMYFPLLDSPISPSIRNLQKWIESAWAAGFDKEGAKELRKLEGTQKWIGTSDLWVAFTFRGIPVELVDFDLKNKPQGHEAVINWIVNYFTPSHKDQTSLYDSLKGASPVAVTNRMPLILQHNGHSRTIVGYATNKNGATTLLTFDPAHCISKDLRKFILQEHPVCSADSRPAKKARVISDTSLRGEGNDSNSDVEIIEVSELASITGAASSKVVDENEVVFVGSSTNTPSRLKGGTTRTGDGLDPHSILKDFRLDIKKLRKKDEYQILYFPMTAPLTDAERQKRRVVESTKVHV